MSQAISLPITATNNHASIHYFSRLFDLHPFWISRLFANGIQSESAIHSFLYPSLSLLHNPFSLPDMRAAVTRIYRAIENQELIVVYGDYDCDGISSTTILVHAIKRLGGIVHYRIPTRKDGYGLTPDAVNKVRSQHPKLSLIVTVDNGSSSHEALLYAKSLGIDTVVTDHHDITGTHPPCIAFVNPKRSDSTYPFPDLAGCGVAFKLIHALFATHQIPITDYMWDYMEWVALGTIADMVPLRDENRVFASYGMQKWNTRPNLFFQSLFKRFYLTTITSQDIQFRIGPAINAVGRIDDANPIPSQGISFQDLSLTHWIHQTNRERKRLCEEQFVICEHTAVSHINDPSLVIHGHFHEGIIGILAARLMNKYKKPSIVISENGKASMRCPAGHHALAMLQEQAEFLTKYGGHQGAAGFSIEPECIPSFRQALCQNTKTIEQEQAKLLYRLSVSEFRGALSDGWFSFEPFGMCNPAPSFLTTHALIEKIHSFGSQKQYRKLLIEQQPVMYFGSPHSPLQAGDRITFSYTPSFRSFTIDELHHSQLSTT